MAEQAAFNTRETAAAVLKEEVRQLKKYRERGNPNLRLLESKNKKVNDAKEDLMNKHYHYGLKAGKELNSAEMTDYLNQKLDDANDEMDEVLLMIDNMQNTENDLARDNQKAAEDNALKERKTYELKIA
jgi:prefoldin subunit 5